MGGGVPLDVRGLNKSIIVTTSVCNYLPLTSKPHHHKTNEQYTKIDFYFIIQNYSILQPFNNPR